MNNWLKAIASRISLPMAILQCRITGKRKPLVVLFYVTDRCNLSCLYCVGNWSGRRIKDLTTEEIIRIIDECKDLGARHFTIHGGEILLRNDIATIISHLKRSGLYVNLVTNGILLPEKIDLLKDIDSLCISLDGREENNDLTRGKGSYKKIMDAICIAKDHRMKFNVHATLTRKNISDIEYLAQEARRIGYYQQFSLLLKPLGPDPHGLGLSDEEARKALSEITRLKKAGYPIFTSYRVLNNAIHWPFPYDKARLTAAELKAQKAHDLIKCFYGQLKIAIDADGRLYPCSSLNDTFEALNVKEVGVKKAYEHMLAHNDCRACFYLTQNDWSLLLSGSPGQFISQVWIQLREIFQLY